MWKNPDRESLAWCFANSGTSEFIDRACNCDSPSRVYNHPNMHGQQKPSRVSEVYSNWTVVMQRLIHVPGLYLCPTNGIDLFERSLNR